jgi:hypothetical protein
MLWHRRPPVQKHFSWRCACRAALSLALQPSALPHSTPLPAMHVGIACRHHTCTDSWCLHGARGCSMPGSPPIIDTCAVTESETQLGLPQPQYKPPAPAGGMAALPAPRAVPVLASPRRPCTDPRRRHQTVGAGPQVRAGLAQRRRRQRRPLSARPLSAAAPPPPASAPAGSRPAAPAPARACPAAPAARPPGRPAAGPPPP